MESNETHTPVFSPSPLPNGEGPGERLEGLSPIIIAEAGVNHNGSLDMALQLVEQAAAAGADYVKFQTFRAERLVARRAEKAEYQKQATREGGEESQLEMLRRLELSPEAHLRLMEHCRRCGIRFLSTAFDDESIDFLHTLGLGVWKIPSGEITNYPYLCRVARFGEPVILSTGMSTLKEVREAVGVLTSHGTPRQAITLLHCNTEYPTPWQDVNLRAMLQLREELQLPVGYSDHTRGIEIPIAATALGATVIEKHFTLDSTLPGPDHRASLEPTELKAMVTAIRHTALALGDGQKRVSPSEAKNINVARKSIVAARPIRKGERFSEENLTVKRPGGGISPMRWEAVIGQVASRDFEEEEQIS